MSVSAVIPTLNAASRLDGLFDMLFNQEAVTPNKVILVDSMSTDGTQDVASRYENVSVIPIENFSHGRARNMGAAVATGDVVVLLTQDALPGDRRWLSKLLAPLDDPRVVATYSRQLPYEDASPMECYFLETRFPPGDPVRRDKGDKEELHLQDVFFSNVAAAIRRDILLKYPFDEDLIMSEDQLFAKDIINAGYATVYVPDSLVYHSHNYSLSIALKRYFDSVYSLSLIFPSHDFSTSAGIGSRYVFKELGFITKRHPRWLPYYVLYTIAKTMGTVLAHTADVLPKWFLKRISLHSYYWD